MPGWSHVLDIYDIYNSLGTTHPTERQWKYQQNLASMPLVGGIYRDWMVGRSTNERNDYTRDLYGIKWDDIKYPWLSGLTNTSPGAKAFWGAAATTSIPAIMKIYGDERRRYHKSDQPLPGYA